METLRITLSTLVHHANELLNGNRQLRPKTSKDVCIIIIILNGLYLYFKILQDMNCWQKMIKTTKDIEKKLKKCEAKSKEQSILFVFHTLFLQLGLYIFVEPSVAIDALEVRCNMKLKSFVIVTPFFNIFRNCKIVMNIIKLINKKMKIMMNLIGLKLLSN